MNDVLGLAMYDYYNKNRQGKLWIHNKYGAKEEMPVQLYFREAAELPDLEVIALQNCKGKVLDIGAGAGGHVLALQEKGIDVIALEISPKASEVMKLRGVRSIEQKDFFEFKKAGFDTLLLLMNGIGLTGTISRLKIFFKTAKKMLNPGGQLIFDSSDVAYLFEGKLPDYTRYYGEIAYQYEYKKQKSGWFNWLYIDKIKLAQVANEEGWHIQVLYEDEFDQYLARMVFQI